jgi:hypothetical protein
LSGSGILINPNALANSKIATWNVMIRFLALKGGEKLKGEE